MVAPVGSNPEHRRPTEAEDMLERIAAHVAEAAPSRTVHHSDGRVEELLLEREVDGAHYRLVRSFDGPQVGGLSPREREIARLVANGLPNKAIAEVLDISAWTVATHLRRIFGKLGVASRAAMVARLLDPEPQGGSG
jgi:two-component system, NarL family, nitrate/nitrite response regulator NarL